MSTVPPAPSSRPPSPPTGGPPRVPPAGARPVAKQSEIKLVSHSDLFYWWPVWVLAFLMATITYFENHRLAVVPHGTVVEKGPGDDKFTVTLEKEKRPTADLDEAAKLAERNAGIGRYDEPFRPRMSQRQWLGPVFVVGLLLTIVVTNVPLRGLWSFLTLAIFVVIALFISLLNGWDRILGAIGDLHIYVNMAGYLTIGVAVFVLWAVATLVFDRRSYIIFTPGQIRYCEHIGASVQVYSTAGVSMEKQRDDIFRHYILGFGSGDLIVRTGGHDRHDIKLPNVLMIGSRLRTVEEMLRTVSTSSANS